MANRRPIIVGNWKMNTRRSSALALAADVARGLLSRPTNVDVGVCPPFVYLEAVGSLIRDTGAPIAVGAQDVWHQPDGAFTGEVSAGMLKDLGVDLVIVGHSERRHIIGESDELVGLKARAALDAGLRCILCVGETLEQRQAGRTDEVNERQLRAGLRGVPPDHIERLTIAYEPVWAIGTGRNASPADAQAAHRHVRNVLSELYGEAAAASIRIQYGGSVKPEIVPELLSQPDVDGGLVGGASLQAGMFLRAIRAAEE